MKKKENKPSAGTARAHVFYGGRVQGVGFRYTAERFAMDLKLCGWVKNLPDGRVELLCEGPTTKIEMFLKQICASTLGPYIRNTDCRWENATGEFDDFKVEFDY